MAQDSRTTKRQLIAELEELRQRLGELEGADAGRKRAEETLRESEELFRLLMENAFDGINICEFDPTTLKRRLIFCNERYVAMSGYTKQELNRAEDLNELIVQHRSEEELRSDYDCILRGVPFNGTASWKRRDHADNTYEWSAVSIKKGDKFHIIGVDRDITGRKRAEEALRESEEKFRLLSEQSMMGICILQDELLKYANQTASDILGYSVEEILNWGPGEYAKVINAEDRAFVMEQGRKKQAGEKDVVANYEWRTVTRTGETTWVEMYSKSVLFEGKTADLVTIIDVTERKRAEEALRESEERFRNLMEYIPGVSIQGYRTDGTVVYWNKASEDVYGYAAHEAEGKNLGDLIVPSNVRPLFDKSLEIGKKLTTSGEFMPPGELLLVHKDGSPVPVYSIHTAVCVEGKKPVLFCIDVDLSEQKRSEEAVREAEKRYRQVFEGAIEGIFVAQDGRIRFSNPAWRQMMGHDQKQLTSVPFMECVHPEDRELVLDRHRRRLSGEDVPTGYDFRIITSGEEIRWVRIRSSMIEWEGRKATLNFLTDITDRKRSEEERLQLEARVQHAQKLESLGVLAGGIAHDFNNLLMGILGNADLAGMDLPSESPVRGSLSEIEKAAQRAAELCRQMLAYAGRGKFLVETLDLSEVVAEMSRMLEVSISKKVALHYDLSDDLLAIEADSTQIRQVVMNLITNASEAIGDSSGVVSVSTGAMRCDRAYLSQSYLDDDLPEGIYAYVEVADTGCGMDEATQGKLFDPFFTTKFTGRGLGLAAVLGIVRGHGGAIEVASAPGRGSTFRVLFPVIEKSPEVQKRSAKEDAALWRGSGTVLLVDDEESVRAVAAGMLEKLGFSVLMAADGREASGVFRDHADEIVCVLLDLTMPHMDGEECLRELREIRPNVCVILSSGYSEEEVTRRFSRQAPAGFIHKPYRSEALTRVLCNVLDDPGKEPPPQ